MTGEYVRDSNGFCIPAGVDEPGELVGEISDETMLSKYTDANATNKKVRNTNSIIVTHIIWCGSTSSHQRQI